MSKFNVGDKVKYIGKDHREMPEFYPEIGTIGTVVKEGGDTDWYIQWTKGSTSREDCWYCDENDIELVENVDMTNEEIWEMLRPKMEKNGLKSTTSTIRLPAKWCYGDPLDIVKSYEENMVHNAIALAYKAGYLRAMKGRPFKIGEKKKKKGGHWEPIDPENLPKEGTRVRCKKEYRECGYDKAIIQVGDLGVVRYLSRFGIKVDYPRTNFVWFGSQNKDITQYFDMWVEDNE